MLIVCWDKFDLHVNLSIYILFFRPKARAWTLVKGKSEKLPIFKYLHPAITSCNINFLVKTHDQSFYSQRTHHKQEIKYATWSFHHGVWLVLIKTSKNSRQWYIWFTRKSYEKGDLSLKCMDIVREALYIGVKKCFYGWGFWGVFVKLKDKTSITV